MLRARNIFIRQYGKWTHCSRTSLQNNGLERLQRWGMEVVGVGKGLKASQTTYREDLSGVWAIDSLKCLWRGWSRDGEAPDDSLWSCSVSSQQLDAHFILFYVFNSKSQDSKGNLAGITQTHSTTMAGSWGEVMTSAYLDVSETDLGNANRPNLFCIFPPPCPRKSISQVNATSLLVLVPKSVPSVQLRMSFCPEHLLPGECEGPMENTCSQGQRETFFPVHLHIFLNFPVTNIFRHWELLVPGVRPGQD